MLQQRLAGLSLEDLEDARGPDSNRRIRFLTICSISAAGMRSPACIIIASRPAVFSATVFPPVFGPVTSSVVAGARILIVTGTACFRSGWRAAWSSNAPSFDRRGSTPSIDSE